MSKKVKGQWIRMVKDFLCKAERQVIRDILFTQKEIHKMTWDKLQSSKQTTLYLFIDNLAAWAEQTAVTGNIKRVYEVTGDCLVIYSQRGTKIWLENGFCFYFKSIAQGKRIRKFQGVLNRPYQRETFEFRREDKPEKLNVNFGPIEVREWERWQMQ